MVSEKKHKKKGEECQKEALTFDEFNTLVEMIKTQNKIYIFRPEWLIKLKKKDF